MTRNVECLFIGEPKGKWNNLLRNQKNLIKPFFENLEGVFPKTVERRMSVLLLNGFQP